MISKLTEFYLPRFIYQSTITIKTQLSYLFVLGLCFSCSTHNDSETYVPQTYSILSLGDSYTKGQGVCDTCGYPVQLKDSLAASFNTQDTFNLKVIAETGWTTAHLITAITAETITNRYDLVTLLIGVNNQFQNRPFSVFEDEFPELITMATNLAQGNKDNVIVITIPDYANTGFGQGFGGPAITEEITLYNNYIEEYCSANDLNLIDAQDLIFDALTNPELIATDNLHPSTLAYSNLVTHLLPLATQVILD